MVPRGFTRRLEVELHYIGGYPPARASQLAKAVALRYANAPELVGYVAAYDEDGWPVILWAEPALLAKAEALAPNERWITLKPHGPDHPDYVHVKIKIWPDGTAHVISGPKGLHGLRLTRLGQGSKARRPLTKEERLQRMAARERYRDLLNQAHQRALEAAKKLLEHPALQRLPHLEELQGELKELLGKQALEAAHDPQAGRMAAGMAAAQHLRRLKGAVKRLERGIL